MKLVTCTCFQVYCFFLFAGGWHFVFWVDGLTVVLVWFCEAWSLIPISHAHICRISQVFVFRCRLITGRHKPTKSTHHCTETTLQYSATTTTTVDTIEAVTDTNRMDDVTTTGDDARLLLTAAAPEGGIFVMLGTKVNECNVNAAAHDELSNSAERSGGSDVYVCLFRLIRGNGDRIEQRNMYVINFCFSLMDCLM